MATITVRQLEVFSQAVKHGSFRNCARQIGVSQVAISDPIRQLEQRLGHKIFERISGEASVLTPAAKRASAHATDRKSVVQGKSVSVRVDLGVRRIHKKQKET